MNKRLAATIARLYRHPARRPSAARDLAVTAVAWLLLDSAWAAARALPDEAYLAPHAAPLTDDEPAQPSQDAMQDAEQDEVQADADADSGVADLQDLPLPRLEERLLAGLDDRVLAQASTTYVQEVETSAYDSIVHVPGGADVAAADAGGISLGWLALAPLALLGGGGGGGGGGGSATPPPAVSLIEKVIRVVDGPVMNAKVYYDKNGDGVAEESEYLGRTDASGLFKFSYQPVAGAKFIAISDEQTVDAFTGNRFALRLEAGDNQGASQLLSPLSALVASGAVSQAQLKQALGLPAGIDLSSFNFVEVIRSGTADAATLAAAQQLTAVSIAVGNMIEATLSARQALKGGTLSASEAEVLGALAFATTAKAMAALPAATSIADLTRIATSLSLATTLDANVTVDGLIAQAGVPLSAAALTQAVNAALPAQGPLIAAEAAQLAQINTQLAQTLQQASSASSLDLLTGTAGAIDQLEDAAQIASYNLVNGLLGLNLVKDGVAVTEQQAAPVRGNLLSNDSVPAGTGLYMVNGVRVPEAIKGSVPDASLVGNSYVLSTSDWGGKPAEQPALAAFLGVQSIEPAGGSPVSGSALRQTIAVNAGQTLTFDFKFGSYDYLPYSDFAFFTLAKAGSVASSDNGVYKVFNTADLKGAQTYQDAGAWKASATATFSYTFKESGSFTFGIGVADAVNGLIDTVLTLQNLRLDGALIAAPAQGLGNTQTNVGQPINDASTLVVAGQYGTLIVQKSGDYVYVPGGGKAVNLPKGQTGQDDFVYTVQGANGVPVAMEKLSITVNGSDYGDTAVDANRAPVAVADALAAVEDQVKSFTAAELLGNDQDADGNPLTIKSVSSGAGGKAVLNADGTVSFTPNPNFNGLATFGYIASDGRLDSAPATVSVNVAAVNDAPTTAAVTLAPVAEDSGPRLITPVELLARAADIDSATLSVSALQISAGSGQLVDNGNGSWTYTPAPNDDTAVGFSYQISDGQASVAASATLDLAPVNDAPTTSPVTLAASDEDKSRLITPAELLAKAADVEGTPLGVSNLQIAPGGKGQLVANADGSWTYTPAPNDDTAVGFSYQISDGQASVAASATLDLAPVNDAPTSSAVTLAASEEDKVRTITQAELLKNAVDIDSATLTASNLMIASGKGQLVDNKDGSWTYTPAANDDTAVGFSYQIGDGQASVAASATLDLTPVNDAPTNSAVTLTALAEDSSPRVLLPSELLAKAADVDGDRLTVSNMKIVTGGRGELVANSNGTWTYTPARDDDSSVGFSYDISDGQVIVAGSATLDLTPVNDAPTTSPVTLAAAVEDNIRTITQFELLANVVDVDSKTFTVSALQITSGKGQVASSGSGLWTYTPAKDDDTQASFGYQISDGQATVAGSATLDLTPVNDAPTTTAVTLAAIAEDSPRTITQAELLRNAFDVEGTALSVSALQIASGSGQLVANADGSWTYTPAPNDDTAVGFSYDISDGQAGVKGSATLDLTPVNDAPVADQPLPKALLEDDKDISGQLSADDVDSGEKATLTYALVNPAPQGLTFNSNGSYSFDARLGYDYLGPGQLLELKVPFVAIDVNGARSQPKDLVLQITGTAEDPKAVADAVSISEDHQQTVQGNLLLNDSDVDTLLAVGQQTLSGSGPYVITGLYGTLTLKTTAGRFDGSYDYLLNNAAVQLLPAGQSFSESFNYTARNTTGYTLKQAGVDTAASTLTITITGSNDAPVIGGDAQGAVTEDAATPTLTDSGSLTITDADSGQAAFQTGVSASAGALGALGITSAGAWSYSVANAAVQYLKAGETKTETFSVRTIDDTPQNLVVTITGVNDAPTTSLVTLAALAEDSPRTLTVADLLANATDIDLDTLTVTELKIASGNGALSGSGPWTYTPAANDDTSVSFSYKIGDGRVTIDGSATLDLTPVNDAPTTAGKTLTINEDASYPFSLADFAFSDASDNPAHAFQSVVIATLPTAGTLKLGGANVTANQAIPVASLGQLVYAPAANGNGNNYATIGFKVRDSGGTANGGTDTSAAATLTINVTALPDAPTATSLPNRTYKDSDAKATLDLLSTASDADGDTLSVTDLVMTYQINGGSAIANPPGLTLTGPVLEVTPTAYQSLNLDKNDQAVITVSYQISDGTLKTPQQTTTITITGVDDILKVNSGTTLTQSLKELKQTGIDRVQVSGTAVPKTLTLALGDGTALPGGSLLPVFEAVDASGNPLVNVELSAMLTVTSAAQLAEAAPLAAALKTAGIDAVRIDLTDANADGYADEVQALLADTTLKSSLATLRGAGLVADQIELGAGLLGSLTLDKTLARSLIDTGLTFAAADYITLQADPVLDAGLKELLKLGVDNVLPLSGTTLALALGSGAALKTTDKLPLFGDSDSNGQLLAGEDPALDVKLSLSGNADLQALQTVASALNAAGIDHLSVPQPELGDLNSLANYAVILLRNAGLNFDVRIDSTVAAGKARFEQVVDIARSGADLLSDTLTGVNLTTMAQTLKDAGIHAIALQDSASVTIGDDLATALQTAGLLTATSKAEVWLDTSTAQLQTSLKSMAGLGVDKVAARGDVKLISDTTVKLGADLGELTTLLQSFVADGTTSSKNLFDHLAKLDVGTVASETVLDQALLPVEVAQPLYDLGVSMVVATIGGQSQEWIYDGADWSKNLPTP